MPSSVEDPDLDAKEKNNIVVDAMEPPLAKSLGFWSVDESDYDDRFYGSIDMPVIDGNTSLDYPKRQNGGPDKKAVEHHWHGLELTLLSL